MDEFKTNDETLDVSDFSYVEKHESGHIKFYADRHEKLKYKPLWIVLDVVLYLVVIFLSAFLLMHFVVQCSAVNGTSMQPTLDNGDMLLLDKLRYRFGDPKRFDIVVVTIDKENKVHYVKRIIGLPGETVQIKDGKVYINGELLEEDVYGKEPIASAGIASEPITLGEDEYFLLGDNRNDSKDSRKESVGVVYRNQIVGRVFFRWSPLSKFGFLNN